MTNTAYRTRFDKDFMYIEQDIYLYTQKSIGSLQRKEGVLYGKYNPSSSKCQDTNSDIQGSWLLHVHSVFSVSFKLHPDRQDNQFLSQCQPSNQPTSYNLSPHTVTQVSNPTNTQLRRGKCMYVYACVDVCFACQHTNTPVPECTCEHETL